MAWRSAAVHGLDGQVAFAVDGHRPVAQVGGADPQQPVVDDHQLGMDHDVGGRAVVAGLGMQQPDAVGDAGGAQDLDEADAARRHGAVLDPAVMDPRRREHRLQPRHLPHPAGQAFGDAGAGQELVLDVDRLLRRIDHVLVQRLDLAHLAFAGIERQGARDADGDIAEIGLDPFGPGNGPGGDGGQRLIAGALPAPAGELGQGPRGGAVDRHLHVVEGRVGDAGRVDAAGCRRPVLGGVPAPDREVEPADEGDRVVDHHDLLVVRGADRDLVVQAQLDLRRRAPLQGEKRQRLRAPARRTASSSTAAA